MLSVVDTCAGPNFIRLSELPLRMSKKPKSGPIHDICEANNRPLEMIGIVRLPVRLGCFLSVADFIVCPKLAAPLVLGADY